MKIKQLQIAIISV